PDGESPRHWLPPATGVRDPVLGHYDRHDGTVNTLGTWVVNAGLRVNSAWRQAASSAASSTSDQRASCQAPSRRCTATKARAARRLVSDLNTPTWRAFSRRARFARSSRLVARR